MMTFKQLHWSRCFLQRYCMRCFCYDELLHGHFTVTCPHHNVFLQISYGIYSKYNLLHLNWYDWAFSSINVLRNKHKTMQSLQILVTAPERLLPVQNLEDISTVDIACKPKQLIYEAMTHSRQLPNMNYAPIQGGFRASFPSKVSKLIKLMQYNIRLKCCICFICSAPCAFIAFLSLPCSVVLQTQRITGNYM